MLPPFERAPDQDKLKLNELSTSLKRFIDRHAGSRVIAGEVMRAINEIARLYHNARARALSAERREADASRGCCQTDANSSQFWQAPRKLGGAERPPLGESGGAVQLVGAAAREAPFRVEEVVH